jgi:hypothetical protein
MGVKDSPFVIGKLYPGRVVPLSGVLGVELALVCEDIFIFNFILI